MKKRKQKRWTSEQQIIEAIESAKDMQKWFIFEADKLRVSAGVLRGLNRFALREEIMDRLNKADRAIARADRYEAKVRELIVKLAQFRTELMPLDGNTDRAVA